MKHKLVWIDRDGFHETNFESNSNHSDIAMTIVQSLRKNTALQCSAIELYEWVSNKWEPVYKLEK